MFFIWLFISFLFIALGIYAFVCKKQVYFGFWASPFGIRTHAEQNFPVNDLKAYNRAVGKLWIVFGIVLACLGLPILKGQNSPLIIFTILGTMAETIMVMAVYVTVIEKKYRKK